MSITSTNHKPVKTSFGYHYRGINIREISGTRVFFQYNIVEGCNGEVSTPFYPTMEQTCRSIDALLIVGSSSNSDTGLN
jgi:hypothetical protein